MKQFEYKVLNVSDQGFWSTKIDHQELADKLNELGRQGWELISGMDTNRYDGSSKELVLILKRESNN